MQSATAIRKNSLFDYFNQELANSEFSQITNSNSFPSIKVSMFEDKLGRYTFFLPNFKFNTKLGPIIDLKAALIFNLDHLFYLITHRL